MTLDINKYCAEKLKTLRLKKNLTQKELAEELGTTQQQIARYENNLRMFKQDFLFQLANYFNISINDFFPPSNFSSNLSKEQEQQLLKDVLKRKGFLDENEELTEENYNRLIDFAKANKQFIMKDSEKK